MTARTAALFLLLSTLLLSAMWAKRGVNAYSPESEALVIAAMRYQVEHRQLPPGGLMIVSYGDTTYPSSSGLQGVVAGLIARRFSREYREMLPRPVEYPDAWYTHVGSLGMTVVALKAAMVVGTAALLALFALFVAESWGLAGGVTVVVLLANSYWLAWWSSSLFWCAPLLFAPFVASWFAMQRVRQGTMPFWVLCVTVGGLLMLKSLTGYEYLSSILSAASVPIVYYAVLDRRPLAETVRRVVVLGASGVVGFLGALAIHLTQLTTVRGSLASAIDAVRGRMNVAMFFAPMEPGYPASRIFHEYPHQELLALSRLNLPLWAFLIILPAAAVACLHRSRQGGAAAAEWRAAGLSLCYALACSLSWPLVAFEHFVAASHLDLIVFFIPAALMLFAMPALALHARRVERQTP